jgi:L,D-transpeptidase catalytic domain
MKLFLLPALALLFSINASASVSSSGIELPDLLSTDELAQEFSGFPDEDLGPIPFRSDRLQITVNKALEDETLVVTLDGTELYSWPTSTGSEEWVDTPSGSHEFTETPDGQFRIRKMVKDYVSRTWRAPMPNAMFFNRGIAIHGTTHEDLLGKPVSGGCVRLSLADAETLWNLVKETGARNTLIIVQSAPAE